MTVRLVAATAFGMVLWAAGLLVGWFNLSNVRISTWINLMRFDEQILILAALPLLILASCLASEIFHLIFNRICRHH